MVTADDVFSWSRKAKPGERLVYHRGGKLAIADKPVFSEAAHAARHLYNLGLVDLAQRRTKRSPRGKFQWFMEKRSEARPPRPAYHRCGLAKHRFVIPDDIVARAA